MSHLKGIAFESPEVQLQKLRERLRLMSDEEVVNLARWFAGWLSRGLASCPTRGKSNCRRRVRSGGDGSRKRIDKREKRANVPPSLNGSSTVAPLDVSRVFLVST